MRKLTLLGLMIAALGVSLLAGCSNPPPLTSAAVTGTSSTYRIGAGDQLEIYVADKPNLSATVPVGPDGYIAIPLVQSVEAAGKTPGQLAKVLEDRLSRYVHNPAVTVIVRSFNGVYNSEVRIIGQAVKPQALPYRSGMTLLDALIAVGGLTPFAAGNRAEVIRKVDGKEHVYRAYLGSLLDGNMKDNAPLQPGDVIVIPQKLF